MASFDPLCDFDGSLCFEVEKEHVEESGYD
jgi:hypothetical protein